VQNSIRDNSGKIPSVVRLFFGQEKMFVFSADKYMMQVKKAGCS